MPYSTLRGGNRPPPSEIRILRVNIQVHDGYFHLRPVDCRELATAARACTESFFAEVAAPIQAEQDE